MKVTLPGIALVLVSIAVANQLGQRVAAYAVEPPQCSWDYGPPAGNLCSACANVACPNCQTGNPAFCPGGLLVCTAKRSIIAGDRFQTIVTPTPDEVCWRTYECQLQGECEAPWNKCLSDLKTVNGQSTNKEPNATLVGECAETL